MDEEWASLLLCDGVEKEESTFNRQSISFLYCLAKMCETEPSSKISLKVDNGTTGLLLWLFLFPTTVTKESKETQLLAGPNKRVTKVYSSWKASFSEDQNRFNQLKSMRVPPGKEGIFWGGQGRKRQDISFSVERESSHSENALLCARRSRFSQWVSNDPLNWLVQFRDFSWRMTNGTDDPIKESSDLLA